MPRYWLQALTAPSFSEALLIRTAGGDNDAGDDEYSVNDDDDICGDDDDDLPGPSILLTPSAALMQKRFL